MRRSSLSVFSHPLVTGFYGPYFLMCTADSLLTPVLPVYAAQLGADYAGIGAVVGASAIGMIAWNVPCGLLIRRLGSRRTLLCALLGSVILLLMGLLVHSVWTLIALRFVMGMVMATLNMSEHTYLAAAIDPKHRGKWMSSFGGILRGGFLVGPVIGGFLALRGGAGSVFVAAALLYAVALLIMTRWMPRVTETLKSKSLPGQNRWRRVTREHGYTLATAGLAVSLGQMVRAGRPLLIPVYAAKVLHLDVGTIGTILSIGALFDLGMFYPAGYVMDRFGRKWALMPSFGIIALGIILIPFAQNAAGITLVALLIGFGNGLGSGSLITLGTDLAPDDLKSEFISLWRLIGDTGTTTAPFIAGAIASTLSLTPAIWVIGASGILSVLIFGFYVPETHPRVFHRDEASIHAAETPQAALEPR